MKKANKKLKQSMFTKVLAIVLAALMVAGTATIVIALILS